MSYIKEAKLSGSLFQPNDSTGLVCGLDTGFSVNHDEPLEVLGKIRRTFEWPLGDLPEDHEYLLILQSKRSRTRSRQGVKHES